MFHVLMLINPTKAQQYFSATFRTLARILCIGYYVLNNLCGGGGDHAYVVSFMLVGVNSCSLFIKEKSDPLYCVAACCVF